MDDRKVIILGERDGIPGPTIAECLEAAGREIIFQKTECFVHAGVFVFASMFE